MLFKSTTTRGARVESTQKTISGTYVNKVNALKSNKSTPKPTITGTHVK